MAPVDCETALRRLAAAEQVLAQARARVERQRKIVTELERGGHDPAQGYALLATFEASQATYEQRLANIVSELAQCGWKLTGA